MKLSSFENEKAVELIGKILKPTANIFTDPIIKKAIAKKTNNIDLISLVLEKHPKDIVFILATLDGKTVKEYKANVIQMTTSLLDMINDPIIADFFTSQAQEIAKESSGVPTENTEEIEET